MIACKYMLKLVQFWEEYESGGVMLYTVASRGHYAEHVRRTFSPLQNIRGQRGVDLHATEVNFLATAIEALRKRKASVCNVEADSICGAIVWHG